MSFDKILCIMNFLSICIYLRVDKANAIFFLQFSFSVAFDIMILNILITLNKLLYFQWVHCWVSFFVVVDLDVWSAGCVLAELLLGQPIFPGASGVDQLVEIIKVLGTPTREQIKEMNPHYTEFKFPQIKPHPWSKVKINKITFFAFDVQCKQLNLSNIWKQVTYI